MFKFLHAADIHLDSPLKGLDAYEGAPREAIRNASRKALTNLVDRSLDLEVDFVVIAGDVFDGDWSDYHTGMFFINQINRLSRSEVPTFLIRGNHDAASRISKRLALPPHVHLLSSGKAETKILEKFGVAIHGQSFATQAVVDDLSESYPVPEPDCFNIGILHTSADGREGHARYAPCSVDRLIDRGYDYWALGHVHTREVLSKPGEPPIVFPGNLQGRHSRETGAKGATLVTVDAKKTVIEELVVDVLRWEKCVLDASEAESLDDLYAVFASELEKTLKRSEDKPLAVRVEVHGASLLHSQLHAHFDGFVHEIRNQANQAATDQVWVEKVKLLTRLPKPRTSGDDSPREALFDFIEKIKSDAGMLAELENELEDLKKQLPPELKIGEDALDVASERAVTSALERALCVLEEQFLEAGASGKL